jgi:hypothetical protein
MADKPIPIMDLKKVIEVLLPRRKTRQQHQRTPGLLHLNLAQSKQGPDTKARIGPTFKLNKR